MIEKIAIRLSNAWGENGVVTTEDVECYRYGLELMISTIFNFILTVVVSVVLAKPYSFLPIGKKSIYATSDYRHILRR